jgi:hypothetical protein
VTIEKLSDEVLLRTFLHYLDSSPQFWHTVVHICRRWRHIIFTSHQTLRLRLFCTHGTPVSKTLDCWPALPIVVEYGGCSELKPPGPEDEENVLAALKHSDRVSSIHLTVTKSLLKKLSSIRGKFSELKDLVLLSHSDRPLTLPSTFLSGPRLRRFHSTGVSFSAPLRFLLSSRDLVDVQLHDIPDSSLSPKTLADALSRLAHLRSLSLSYGVRFAAITNIQANIPPLSEEFVVKRVVIPSLSCLKYQGMSIYLDTFLGRLDAPRLADIEITFFYETRSEVSKLSEFINRTDMWKSHLQADIRFSWLSDTTSISLTRSAPTCLKFQVNLYNSILDPLRSQMLSMARLCRDFPAFHLWVEDLRIKVTGPGIGSLLFDWLKNVDCETWAMLIRSFEAAKCVHIAGDISTEVLRALRLWEGRRATLLPLLAKPCDSQSGTCDSRDPLREAVVSLIVDCRLSSRPIVGYIQVWIGLDELAGMG